MAGKIKITSPDQLVNYIRVTNPGIWVILSAIIVFLVGFMIWIFTGELEISFAAQIYMDGNEARASLTPENFSQARKGMEVRIANSNKTGKVTSMSRENNSVAIKFDDTHVSPSRAFFITDKVRPIHFLLK